LSFLP